MQLSGNNQATHLVKSWEDVIGELDFSNGSVTHCRHANTKACNALFCQWCVEDSLSA